MENPTAADVFSESERAALAFAEQLTTDPKRVSDALWDELCRHFDEGEIVELAAVAGLFNYFNRVNDALQMDITQPGWPGSDPPPA